eukprot:2741510-Rhodomonas_salina.1
MGLLDLLLAYPSSKPPLTLLLQILPGPASPPPWSQFGTVLGTVWSAIPGTDLGTVLSGTDLARGCSALAALLLDCCLAARRTDALPRGFLGSKVDHERYQPTHLLRHVRYCRVRILLHAGTGMEYGATVSLGRHGATRREREEGRVHQLVATLYRPKQLLGDFRYWRTGYATTRLRCPAAFHLPVYPSRYPLAPKPGLPAYARATRCPVLTCRMLLPADSLGLPPARERLQATGRPCEVPRTTPSCAVSGTDVSYRATRPIVMIGPGTGVAPFLGLVPLSSYALPTRSPILTSAMPLPGFIKHRTTLQEEVSSPPIVLRRCYAVPVRAEHSVIASRCEGYWRALPVTLPDETVEEKEAKIGKMWLYFGCRDPNHDFLYRKELEKLEGGDQIKLTTAFSRVGAEKVYVQHRMKQVRGERKREGGNGREGKGGNGREGKEGRDGR